MILKRKKSPGQKLADNLSQKSKYWISTVVGLTLITTGLFFLFEIHNENTLKSDYYAKWILRLLLLGMFNLGLLILGNGVSIKTKIQLKKAAKERQKKFKKRTKQKVTSEPLTIQKNPS